MSLTFLQMKTKFGQFTRNNSAANLTLGGELINQATQNRLSGVDYSFSRTTTVIPTIAGTANYTLPVNTDKVRYGIIESGGTEYRLTQVKDIELWRALKISNSSGRPQWYYLTDISMEVFPTPNVVENMTFYITIYPTEMTLDADESIFPQGYEYLPVFDAVADYYFSEPEHSNIAANWKAKADALEFNLRTLQQTDSTDVSLNAKAGLPDIINPNFVGVTIT